MREVLINLLSDPITDFKANMLLTIGIVFVAPYLILGSIWLDNYFKRKEAGA